MDDDASRGAEKREGKREERDTWRERELAVSRAESPLLAPRAGLALSVASRPMCGEMADRDRERCAVVGKTCVVLHVWCV